MIPQMAPLLWLFLFLYFIGLYMFFMTHLYYFNAVCSYSSPVSTSSSFSGSLNWMW